MLKINKLLFKDLQHKLTIYLQIQEFIPGNKAHVIIESSTNTQESLVLGTMLRLNENQEYSNIQTLFFTDEVDHMRIINSANISVFDTNMICNIWINDNNLQFTSTATIFDNIRVSIQATACTE